MTLQDIKEIESLGNEFESKTSIDIIAYALERFGYGVSLASSFGAEDVALIAMMSVIKPCPRVFLLDTGYLFKETLELIEKLKDKYKIHLDIYTPEASIEEMEKKHGEKLHEFNPNLCCEIRKLEPLGRALADLDAWITGIRRDQTIMRSNAKKIEFDEKFKLIKFNPIADWTSEQVWTYIRENNVPYNTLHDKSYPSIGCEPCTKPVIEGEDPRSGRWSSMEKTECGLHPN